MGAHLLIQQTLIHIFSLKPTCKLRVILI